MRSIIFGKSGQVARELARCVPDATFLARSDVDLADLDAVKAAILGIDAEVVINAAAWTDVDGAEANRQAAHEVNEKAPGAMAQACRTKGIPLVHVSTDYVFDGRGEQPFAPVDPTNPLGVYGASKLAGERAIRAAGCAHVVLRTSWVFSAHGKNFVKTMLRLSDSRSDLAIVADQIGGPTSARSIADALHQIAKTLVGAPEHSGVYHFSGTPDVSWADFARTIFAKADRDVAVTEIETKDYPTPAIRPLNSRLDCRETLLAFGLQRPDWRHDLDLVLKDLAEAT